MTNNDIENIYNTYYKELYLYVLSLCKDHYIAEEIVSDTFYKALISINQCHTHIKFWLYRVSKNLWIDSLRKKKHFTNDTLEENTLSSKEDILDKILSDERRKSIYNAVITLPNTYKEVIILYYFCSFSLNNIAESMNISQGAARTLLYRARNKLRLILKEDM